MELHDLLIALDYLVREGFVILSSAKNWTESVKGGAFPVLTGKETLFFGPVMILLS